MKGTIAINTQKLESDILTSISLLVKDYINTGLFNHIYHSKVSEAQETETARALKE